MKIIADTSILIYLARVGLLKLLRDLYSEIMISRGGFTEVVERGWGLPGSRETEKGVREGWIRVKEVIDRSKVKEIGSIYKIHFINAETIQLAVEEGCDIFLADELEVRELAKRRGFRVKGCLGILVEGVKQGKIKKEEAKGKACELVESGYWISEEVLKEFDIILEET